MNFKIDELSNLCFMNMETGLKYNLPNALVEVEDMSPNEKPEVRTFGSCSASFTCDNAVINEDLLTNCLMPHTFDLEYSVMKQTRKHRKKRINKKWLKRYGYKLQQVTSKGWKMKEFNTQTCEVELVNDHI
jgi:hypothetical protein